MNKIKFLLIIFYFLNILFLQSQNNCNYIGSGYYQLIYEFEEAYLRGDENAAWEKLQQAETICPLIEQEVPAEMSRYVRLLIKRGVYDKAFYYIDKLVSEYGYDVREFENYDGFEKFNSAIDWKSIKKQLEEKEKIFYSHERKELIERIKVMMAKDLLADEGIFQYLPARLKELGIDDSILFKEAMDIYEKNLTEMLEILKKYGYPGLKLLGYRNKNVVNYMQFPMFMHFHDNDSIYPLLMNNLIAGNGYPDLYGRMKDRRELQSPEGIEKDENGNLRMKWKEKCVIYGAFTNIDDSRIIDIDNIDNRRLSIGMPTREMEKKLRYLRGLEKNGK